MMSSPVACWWIVEFSSLQTSSSCTTAVLPFTRLMKCILACSGRIETTSVVLESSHQALSIGGGFKA